MGVPVERIYKIETFLPKDSSYTRELRIWKKIVASNKKKHRKDIIIEEEKNGNKRRKREWRNCICGKKFFVLKSKE
jgi:hypothetical protein